MSTYVGKTVLVAEDDAFISKVYGLALKKEGFDVVFVRDGVEALQAIEKKMPDLILLDLVMPNMDGFVFLEKLRSNPATANIKVMILSNLGQESDIESVSQYNVLDYIIKSNTHIKEIVEKIQSILAKD